MKTIWLYVCLIAGVALGLWAMEPPPPASVHAPDTEFSAERAMSDVRAISRHSHPSGSAEHARVAAYLMDRLAAMGLTPVIGQQTGRVQWDSAMVAAATVRNIVARLPGTNPALPALALIAHYDSVPHSPASADDGAGVAAVLEMARALSRTPRQRDVLLVLTDGEEIGLLGAEAFFHHDPLARHIGAVINLDMRGAGGRAIMYETGPASGWLISHLPMSLTANSATAMVYDAMPNGSDFTMAKQAGLPGLNLALIGDPAAYHTPLATADRLNSGSLQMIGDAALAAALPVVQSDGALSGPDLVYGDLFSRVQISYPPVWGWAFLAFAMLCLMLALWRGRASEAGAVWRGLFCSLLMLTCATLVIWPSGQILAQLSWYQRVPLMPLLSIGALCLVIATTALIGYAARNGRGRWFLAFVILLATGLSCITGFDPVAAGLGVASLLFLLIGLHRPLETPALWRGSLILSLVIGIGVQATLPGVAPMVVWPLCIAALTAAWFFSTTGGRTERPVAHIVIGLIAIILMGHLAGLGKVLFDALGLNFPAVIVIPLLLGLPALMPLIAEAGGERSAPELAILILLGGILTVAATVLVPTSSKQPMASAVYFAENLNCGTAYHVAPMKYLDPWARSALHANGNEPVYGPIDGISDTPVWSVPVNTDRKAAKATIATTISRQNGRLVITAMPSATDEALELAIYSDTELTGQRLNGEAVSGSIAPVRWHRVLFTAPPQNGVVWTFKAPVHGKVSARITAISSQWPAQAGTLPILPADTIMVGSSGSSRQSRTISLKW